MGVFDFFKPAWQSEDEGKALRAIEKITSQEKLAEIIKSPECPDNNEFCELIIGKITDQSILVDIAKSVNNYSLRKIAADKCTDRSLVQEAYIEIARNSANAKEQVAAIQKLSSQTLQENQTLLADIAKKFIVNKTDNSLIKAVISKITGQSILEDLVMNSSVSDNQTDIIIKNITDQTMLENIARRAPGTYARTCAVKRLTGQTVLEDFARNADSDNHVKHAAMRAITDQSILAKIVRAEHADESLTEQMIKKISDKSLLAEIANDNNASKDARIMAAEKLKNHGLLQEIYADIVKTGGNGACAWRLSAFDKLNDILLLTEIAESNDEEIYTCIESIPIYESTDSNTVVGTEYTKWDFRDGARQKLDNPDIQPSFCHRWEE